MRRITVSLTNDLWDAISVRAEKEIHYPKQQVEVILRQELLGSNAGTHGLRRCRVGLSHKIRVINSHTFSPRRLCSHPHSFS